MEYAPAARGVLAPPARARSAAQDDASCALSGSLRSLLEPCEEGAGAPEGWAGRGGGSLLPVRQRCGPLSGSAGKDSPAHPAGSVGAPRDAGIVPSGALTLLH